MCDVNTAWGRIERWYAANVPPDEFYLADGASNAEILAFEQDLGVVLPADARASYRLHNGSDQYAVFEYGFHLLSLEEVSQSWRMWKENLDAGVFDGMTPDPEGPIKSDWWNEKWIPITHNSGGDHHCIDMDPDRGGTIGQLIKFSHEPGPQRVVAGSMNEWLHDFATELESAKYKFDEDNLWLIPVDG